MIGVLVFIAGALFGAVLTERDEIRRALLSALLFGVFLGSGLAVWL